MQGLLLLTPWGNLAMFSDNGIAVSHELSNALEAATNLIYLIRIGRRDPAKVLEWAQLADSQLQRMAKIVHPGQS
jgi:hypothetical protein